MPSSNKIKESSSQFVETPINENAKEEEEEEEEQPKTNGNPLNKKSFYYSRFTKVCFCYLIQTKNISNPNPNTKINTKW